MVEEKRGLTAHPEGLTETQEGLANLLFDTKTQAKVGRRREVRDEAGKLLRYELYTVVRDTSPIDFPVNNEEFALKLHETRPEAPLSLIYINLRNLPENLYEQIGKVLAEMPSEEKPDFCVGIPTAGTPIAEAYSKFSGVPVIDIFTKEQTETGRRIVAGEKVEERRVKIRLIDDLVTRAHTKLEAIKAAESLGYEVTDILVLVDREQGGKDQLAVAGYKLLAAFPLSQLLNYYKRVGEIDQARYEEVTAYLAANR